MSRELDHFQSVTKPNLERLFNDGIDVFSDPFRVVVGRFRTGTINFIQDLLEEEIRLRQVSGNDINHYLPQWEQITKRFMNSLKEKDKMYKEIHERTSRMLLDTMGLLRRDPQVEALIHEYKEKELQHFHTFHLFVPEDKGFVVGIKNVGNIYVMGDVGNRYLARIDTKIKFMGEKLTQTIRQAIAYITKQEQFLEEKQLQQQSQPYLLPSGTTQPQLPAGSQEKQPSFTKEDPGLLSLHEMREDLFRTLNSI